MKRGQVDSSGARRSRNRMNAFQFAKVGLYVFPSDGKVPLVPRYNRADTTLKREEVEQAAEEFESKSGKMPVHVGATRDPEVIKRMWRAFPDAVPSISCGPSKLVVLDADKKDDGPAKMAELWAEIGGVPEGVPINPTKSGGQHFVFTDPEGKFSNKAGLLKKQYGTDVRGTGGQFVAPGSIREDGATYGSDNDRLNFLRAITGGKIPQLPEEIVELIGAQSAEAQGNDVTPTQERAVIQRLEDADPDLYQHDFEPDLGKYDLEGLKRENSDFAKLYDAPGADCSTNRFLAARHIMSEWPDMAPPSLAVFFSLWEGAGSFSDEKPKSGEYDNRQIAREWIKNQGLKKEKPSNGDALGPVEDDEVQGIADDVRTGHGFAFELEHVVATNAKPPTWLVHEILEEQTLSVVYGQPNSGKSLVLLDMLFHIAAGKPWRDRDVKRGCVLYLAVEGPNGTARRAKAWRMHHAVADSDCLPLAFIRAGVNLYANKRDAKKIVAAVSQLEKITGLPCVAVAIDTLSAVTPGMDQNNEMGTFVQHCRTILEGTRAAVIVVHHDGKDQSRGLRGGSELLGTADSTVLVKDRVVTTKKMRDGRSDQKFPFDVRILNLWTDEKGRPVGAPVAVEVVRGAALTAVEETDEDSLPVPPDGPSDKLAATLRVFRERAERIAAETGDEVEEIGLASKDVLDALNVDRKRSGLDELKERTAVPRLLAKLVEAGELLKSGDNRRTEYRLSCSFREE